MRIFCTCFPIVAFAATTLLASEEIDEFAMLQRKIEGADSAWASLSAAQREAQPDPRRSLLERMITIFERNPDAENGKSMGVGVFYWSLQIGHEGVPDRLLTFAKRFPDERRVVDMIYDAEANFDDISTGDAWLSVLKQVSGMMKSPKMTAATKFFSSRILLDQGHLNAAIKGLEAVRSGAAPEQAKERAATLINAARSLQVGMVMPDFEATTLDGDKVKLSSLRGKVVLVDFWATWCGPCVAEMPNLQKAAKQFGEKFVVLSISADDSAGTVKRFKKKKPIPGIATWDGKNGAFPLMEKFHIEGLPTWYLLDAKGRIVSVDAFGKRLIPSIEKAFAATN